MVVGSPPNLVTTSAVASSVFAIYARKPDRAHPDVPAKLADLDEQIRALPDDAFEEKHELLKKRDVLRERAAEHAVEADQTGRLLICFPSWRSQNLILYR